MVVFQVNSIPLKDVIISLAKSFGVAHNNQGDEYFLFLPKELGEGEIRGVNFDSGLGLLIYKVVFKEDIRLEFTLDEIHPVKFIYPLRGLLRYEFEDERIKYDIAEYRSAIVASKRKNGHILEFIRNTQYEIVSVEIDRKTFGKQSHYELTKWDSKLQNVLRDVNAEQRFLHISNSGLYFKDVLLSAEKYKDFLLARMFNLQSITMEIFVNQIAQYDDDILKPAERVILRISELKTIEDLGDFIATNITDEHTIKNLALRSGLSAAKLQYGFKYLFSLSVNEFVINTRLGRAYSLLQNREYNVSDVVMAVGLESNSYFTRIFKKRYGITPNEFRKVFNKV